MHGHQMPVPDVSSLHMLNQILEAYLASPLYSALELPDAESSKEYNLGSACLEA